MAMHAAETKHLHGVMDELLPHAHGGAADADALDALLGGEDAGLWNEPALFGSLAPGLQCSEACHRPGQRCLDPTHPAHCSKCIASPCEADVGVYELVGEAGKKNGEKRLRTLLARTREWNSVEVRTRTAEECAGLTGYSELADILRTKRCVLLKKVHMLFLARVWNYRCDLWCRRGDRIRKQPATAVAAAAAAMAAAASDASAGGSPLHVSAPVQPEAVMAYVAKTLRPLALESARLAAGRRAAAACATGSGEAAFLTVDTLAELRAVQGCFAASEAAAAGVHAALCDEAHEISADAAAAPAWTGLSADALASEALVAGLLQLCSALATATQRRGAAPRLTPAEAVWLDELWQAQLLASECAARAQLVLLRIKTQPRGPFLQGAAVVMEALVTLLSSSRANLARREAWVARLLASRPAVGDSSPPSAGRAASPRGAAAAPELPPALAAVVASHGGGALAAFGNAAAAAGGGSGAMLLPPRGDACANTHQSSEHEAGAPVAAARDASCSRRR